MRVLVTGISGQVGGALLPALSSFETIAADRARLDLSNPDRIVQAVRALRPDVIVNPAAFTSVDRAESEAEAAREVNTRGPGVLAEEARRLGALLVHFSTDYVFDGALRRPYVESDPPRPLSIYGKSKLEGEARVRSSGCRHIILRTSWVYGGRNSFPMLMIGKARRKERLRVVVDQTGVPTWAADVAAMTRSLIERPVEGVWHASAAGQVTRYEYAREILRLARLQADIQPIATSEFPTPAQRPPYSALDSRALAGASGIAAIGPWGDRLKEYLEGAA